MGKWLNGARDGTRGNGCSRSGADRRSGACGNGRRKNSGSRSTNSSCNGGYRKAKNDLSDVQIIKNIYK